MTGNINNLFAAESNATMNSNRGLTGTAQLTNIASDVAATIIREINVAIEANDEHSAEWIERLKKSQSDNNEMDALIESVHPLEEIDIEFLKDLNEQTLDGMLKSQQSKRSRCKSKAMTLDNYRALMTGAIAENLIRIATGKEKHSVGSRRTAGMVEYTIEELQQLGEDQERLRKEIRNVQSKKSIMRSKADFDENDERYVALLRVEQQLKDMRVNATVEVVEVDTTKDAVRDLFNGVDLHHLGAKDSKALLEEIAKLVASNTEETEE